MQQKERDKLLQIMSEGCPFAHWELVVRAALDPEMHDVPKVMSVQVSGQYTTMQNSLRPVPSRSCSIILPSPLSSTKFQIVCGILPAGPVCPLTVLL